eukprot:CAMPEP_0118867768 /NCGR_PEP_ID=MMETSP1163-20130328/11248_1 /TAXON_ID=124430 /ORGANISM="Phaeomonas parva, Strain CCMP2877" /LENGTH=89 /DNA_ID=CAMNT_0006802215 /DNA_START=55 /DNA_END=324 /DNA_ORIENTATION=-
MALALPEMLENVPRFFLVAGAILVLWGVLVALTVVSGSLSGGADSKKDDDAGASKSKAKTPTKSSAASTANVRKSTRKRSKPAHFDPSQ